MEIRQKRDLGDQVFSSRYFVRTLSYREFVTSLSLALLLLALYSILDYYSNSDWIENNATAIKCTLLFIPILGNHVFYKVEHKRHNNFMGRNLHDYILILLFLMLFELQFYIYNSSLSFTIIAPVTIKKWSKVSWDDFRGIPRLFGTYDAGISSSIYLEYDSTRGRFVAYGGQNNVKSWARRSQKEQQYLLNHEQYHFNITELHARMLNDYIDENPDSPEKVYVLRLGSLNVDLDIMHTPTPEGQIFFVPGKNIPKGTYEIKFGYLLSQDSVK